jgi:outer membrane immunogenic protein
VIGLQGMFDGTSIGVSSIAPRFPNVVVNADLNWFATVTAKIGYVISPAFMLYGKLGWGTYETQLTALNTATGVGFAGGGRNRSGFDAGIGGEWMFSRNWSAFIEWDHIFAQNDNFFFPNVGAGATGNVKRDLDKVLLGVNWRFGGMGGPRTY